MSKSHASLSAFASLIGRQGHRATTKTVLPIKETAEYVRQQYDHYLTRGAEKLDCWLAIHEPVQNEPLYYDYSKQTKTGTLNRPALIGLAETLAISEMVLALARGSGRKLEKAKNNLAERYSELSGIKNLNADTRARQFQAFVEVEVQRHQTSLGAAIKALAAGAADRATSVGPGF